MQTVIPGDQSEYDILSNAELFEYRDFFRAELLGLSKRIANEEVVGFKALRLERILKLNLGMVMTAIGKRFRRKKRAKDEAGKPEPLPDTTNISIPEARAQCHGRAPIRFRPQNKEIAVRYN